MYFLTKGRCAVYYGNKRMVSIIEGSYFGEIGCIMGGIRRAGIKALTLCELQALSRRNLNILLAEYPDVGDELKRVAKQRVQQVRSSVVQKKQVHGIRKMLEQRGRILSNSPPLSPKNGMSPQSPGREINKDSEDSSKDDDRADLTPKTRSRIDSVIRRAGGGHSGASPDASPPGGRHSITSITTLEKRSRHMERTMSMTSAFGAQGTGGGAIASDSGGEGSGEGGEAGDLDAYISRKKDEAEAKILAKMESIANAFMEQSGR